jgi:hypothetical protein
VFSISSCSPESRGSRFDFDGTIVCCGDDARLYVVVRRQQWVSAVDPEGQERWRRTQFCNYALENGQPVGLLPDGRLVVAPQGLVLAPL